MSESEVQAGGGAPDGGSAHEDIVRFWELAQELFCVLDEDARFVRVNPAWTRVLGWAPEQLLGRPAFEFVHPEDLDATRHVSVAEGADGQRLEEFHNRYRHRDGSVRWLSWTGYKQGILWYGVGRDVTSMRLSHDALQRSERRSRATLQALREGLVIIDDRGRVIEANGQFAEMVGLPLRDIVGQAPPYPWWPPEDADDIMGLLRHALRGRRNSAQLTFMRRDGTRFPVALDEADLPDREGRVAILTVVRDISELAAAHDRLADAHRLAAFTTWEFFPDEDRIVVHADPLRDGPQDTWTATGAESMRQVDPGSRDELARLRLETARGERATFQLDILTHEPLRWIEVRGQTITDEAGRALGARGTAFDITARKERELAARLQLDALDAGDLALLVCDPDGRVEHASAGTDRLLGRSPGTLTGTRLAELAAAPSDGLLQALATGDAWDGLVEFRDDAGAPVRLLARTAAIGTSTRIAVVLTAQ